MFSKKNAQDNHNFHITTRSAQLCDIKGRGNLQSPCQRSPSNNHSTAATSKEQDKCLTGALLNSKNRPACCYSATQRRPRPQRARRSKQNLRGFIYGGKPPLRKFGEAWLLDLGASILEHPRDAGILHSASGHNQNYACTVRRRTVYAPKNKEKKRGCDRL